MTEPKIKRISLDGYDDINLGVSDGWCPQSPTIDELMKNLSDTKAKFPDLTVKVSIKSHGGEFPYGILYAYGERLETAEEVAKRMENEEYWKKRELEDARRKLAYLEREQEKR